MITILAACVAMFFRDGMATLLTVAEARGRALLAGTLDALCDIAGLAATYFGVDALFTRGLSPHTILLIGCMTLTSFCGTVGWTVLSRRIGAAK